MKRLSAGGCGMTRSWIHFTRGRFVRQARVGLGDLKEEHVSRQGFLGPVAMLYRTEGPNEIVRVEGDYRSRAVDSGDVVAPDRDDPRGEWLALLENDDVVVGLSAIFYKNDPLQTVGWKGDLFPFRLNVRGIIPIMSDRLHVPPSSWVTFEALGFCILTIPPMAAVSNPDAEELPSYHRNIDMDEVMLTHADENPAGRRPGMFRHTPQGILHGATEAYRAEFQKKRQPGQRRTATNVGVDTYRPLIPSAGFVKMAG